MLLRPLISSPNDSHQEGEFGSSLSILVTLVVGREALWVKFEGKESRSPNKLRTKSRSFTNRNVQQQRKKEEHKGGGKKTQQKKEVATWQTNEGREAKQSHVISALKGHRLQTHYRLCNMACNGGLLTEALPLPCFSCFADVGFLYSLSSPPRMASKRKEPKRAEWLEDEENTIIRAVLEGLGPTAIASCFKLPGRTMQQVVNKVGNLRPSINVFKVQVTKGRMNFDDACSDGKCFFFLSKKKLLLIPFSLSNSDLLSLPQRQDPIHGPS
jgi:hypothetical protein